MTTNVRWDIDLDEPYLQLPSFPNLRLTPIRPGDGPDLVSPARPTLALDEKEMSC